MTPHGSEEPPGELTPERLRALSADDIGGAVRRHVRALAGGAPAAEPHVVGALPLGLRAIYLGTMVDAEVNAGGFSRFFAGEGGRYAGAALAGYELLGADEYAAVMRAAIATYETERHRLAAPPQHESPSARRARGALDEVDQRYYALGDRIYNIWAAAVRLRPEWFEE